MWKREIIRIPAKTVITIVVIFVIFFSVVIIIGNKSRKLRRSYINN